jgi:formylglycine-generating enzyme required for sulfatase activity
MVVIPAGSFTMGSPASEKDRYDNEGPQHEVRISAPFAVGKFAITRGQFAAFVNDAGYKPGDSCWIPVKDNFADTKGRSFRDPGFEQDDSHPAVCISWDDAKAYVAWLAKTTGKSYRLLSEAEYEYAGRAGTTTAYFFGNDPNQLCGYANGADRTAKAQLPPTWTTSDCKDGYVYTAPVGSFAANDFGLYDMVGNVWEWVEDCWHDSYAEAPKDGSAWTTGSCENRALRGGAWYDDPRDLRAAYRYGGRPDGRDDGGGFRVARTL